jgi:hypothetical protein
VAGVVDEAVRVRARVARSRGERMLRRLGVRVLAHGVVRRASSAAAMDLDRAAP